jgi:hypothetical protein
MTDVKIKLITPKTKVPKGLPKRTGRRAKGGAKHGPHLGKKRTRGKAKPEYGIYVCVGGYHVRSERPAGVP